MWPDTFGPGWFWGVLSVAGVVAILAAVVRMATRVQAAARVDPVQAVWHQYEIGDLTRREFERLKRARATQAK